MTTSGKSRLPVPIENVILDRRHTSSVPAVLPALRSDLAPLVPAMRRAVTVIAAAAVADWAVRRGTSAVLDHGARAILGEGRRARRRRGGAPPTPRSETVVVERVIVHRTL